MFETVACACTIQVGPMHVLARCDRQHRPVPNQPTRSRLGPFGYKRLALSSRAFCSPEEIMQMLEQHVKPDGNIDTVYVDFENEHIPLCNQGEIRLLARLAAVYHNSLVQKNTNIEPPSVKKPEDTGSNGSTADSDTQDSWDEHEFGDRAYHDVCFEANEDLLPWNQRGADAEERWGL